MTSTSSFDNSFRSIADLQQSAEPAQVTSSHPPASASASASASDNGSQSTMRQQSLSGIRSLNVSGSPSTANSPLSSRDTSPARPPHRQQSSSGPLPKGGRLPSRKSSADVSPNRGPSLAGSSTTIPSAAAIQRALSSANIPQLPPASSAPSTTVQEPSRVPRPSKPPPVSGTNSGDSTPHWPISPRLKSPPPAPDSRSRSRRNSVRTQPKKAESSSTPSIIVQSSSPAPASRIPVKDEGVSDQEEPALSMKVSSRGASGAAPKLETVQEASLPTSPGFDGLEAPRYTSPQRSRSLRRSAVSNATVTSPSRESSLLSLFQADDDSLQTSAQLPKSSDEDERNDVTTAKVTEDLSAKNPRHTESGSDSGISKKEIKGKVQEQRSSSTPRPQNLPSKPSVPSVTNNKARPEAASRNMTVETETVPSIAQASIGNQDRSASGRGDGSLRLKPSNETIRPKKDKSKAKRKAPSITSGTASSKADIFEKKVASAVDEAESSDSDETFVYESNPDTRVRHHHSRTPSMTSISSLIDPRAVIREATRNIPKPKSSMKFATHSYNNSATDADAMDRGEGTVRMASVRAGTGSHHHHIARHGHGRGALNHIVDSDSSFAQPSRARNSSRQNSQPSSPKFHNLRLGNGNGNGNGNGVKKNGDVYDFDADHAADDERTPLIPRPNTRSRQRGRPNSGFRAHERQHRHNGGWCRRFAGCLVLSILLLVLVFSAVGLVFATTKPLYNVKVHDIRNVIASQEEIMLDLVVDAVNPNIIGVTVGDMDVNIFAKSKHVGSDKWWREHSGTHHDQEAWHPLPGSNKDNVHITDGVDEGTDPIEEPPVGEPRIMLLGRIFHFDSSLYFEGSFFKRSSSQSLGELRVAKPGNKTEAGGTERWEEVLQYPFELIVRGVLKYQLPLSTREHTVPINASYYYDPDTEKKKLKALTLDFDSSTLPSTYVSPTPLGRYDVRGRALLEGR